MTFNIRVVPHSSRNLVQKESASSFKVYLTKPAQDNLANRQLKVVLADYLKVKKHQISILRGEKSRLKIVKVDA